METRNTQVTVGDAAALGYIYSTAPFHNPHKLSKPTLSKSNRINDSNNYRPRGILRKHQPIHLPKMATKFDNMIRNAQFGDRANGVPVGGRSAISKVPNKAVRKPLGEISNSNSLKPPQNRFTQKQQNPVDITYLGEKSTFPSNRNKNLSKAVKNGTPSARRPLGDISNSSKPALPHISQKTKIKNTNALELGDPGIDKGFLHNHGECIKNQRQVVDTDYFLETIGHCKVSSLKMAHSLHSVTVEEMDLNMEIPELLPEENSPLSSKAELQMKHNWSPPCKSPQSPSLYMQWGSGDALDCCLSETPTTL